MSERKQYEDLSLEQRFTCDVTRIFDDIAQFGEGLYVCLVVAVVVVYISKALRYGPCITMESHSFTCHPHTNHTCLYSPQQIRFVTLGPLRHA